MTLVLCRALLPSWPLHRYPHPHLAQSRCAKAYPRFRSAFTPKQSKWHKTLLAIPSTRGFIFGSSCGEAHVPRQQEKELSAEQRKYWRMAPLPPTQQNLYVQLERLGVPKRCSVRNWCFACEIDDMHFLFKMRNLVYKNGIDLKPLPI